MATNAVVQCKSCGCAQFEPHLFSPTKCIRCKHNHATQPIQPFQPKMQGNTANINSSVTPAVNTTPKSAVANTAITNNNNNNNNNATNNNTNANWNRTKAQERRSRIIRRGRARPLSMNFQQPPISKDNTTTNTTSSPSPASSLRNIPKVRSSSSATKPINTAPNLSALRSTTISTSSPSMPVARRAATITGDGSDARASISKIDNNTATTTASPINTKKGSLFSNFKRSMSPVMGNVKKISTAAVNLYSGQKEEEKPLDIAGPTNFSHDSHLGLSSKGIEGRNLPIEWQIMLKNLDATLKKMGVEGLTENEAKMILSGKIDIPALETLPPLVVIPPKSPMGKPPSVDRARKFSNPPPSNNNEMAISPSQRTNADKRASRAAGKWSAMSDKNAATNNTINNVGLTTDPTKGKRVEIRPTQASEIDMSADVRDMTSNLETHSVTALLQEEIEQLKEVIRNIDGERQQLLLSNSKIQRENSTLATDLEAKAQQVVQSKEQLASNQYLVNDLRREIKQLKGISRTTVLNSNNRKSLNVTAIQQKNEEIERLRTENKARIAAMQEKSNKEISAVRAQVDAERLSKKDLETKNRDLQLQLQAAKRQIEESEEKQQQLEQNRQSSTANYQQKAANLQKELDQLKLANASTCQSNDLTIKTLSSKVNELSAKIQDAETTVTELKGKLSEQEKAYEAKIDTLKKENDVQLNAMRSTYSSETQTKEDKLRQQIQELQAQETKHKQQVEQLQALVKQESEAKERYTAELANVNKLMDTKIHEMREKFDTLHKEHNALTMTNQELSAELQDFKASKEALQIHQSEESKQFEVRLASVKEQHTDTIQKMQQQLTEQRQSATAWEEKFSVHDKELRATQLKLQEATQHLKTAEANASRISKSLDETTAKLQAQLQTNESLITSLKAEKSKLESQLNATSSTLPALKETIAQLEAKLAANDSASKTQQSKHKQELSAILAEHTTKLEASDATIKQQASKITTLEGSKSALEKQIDELQQRLATSSTSQEQAARDKIKKISEQAQIDLDNMKTLLKADLHKVNAELEAERKLKREQIDTNRQLEEQVQSLEEQLASQKRIEKTQQQQLVDLGAQIKQLEQSDSAVDAENAFLDMKDELEQQHKEHIQEYKTKLEEQLKIRFQLEEKQAQVERLQANATNHIQEIEAKLKLTDERKSSLEATNHTLQQEISMLKSKLQTARSNNVASTNDSSISASNKSSTGAPPPPPPMSKKLVADMSSISSTSGASIKSMQKPKPMALLDQIKSTSSTSLRRVTEEEKEAKAKAKSANSNDMLNVLARALIDRRNNMKEDVDEDDEDEDWGE